MKFRMKGKVSDDRGWSWGGSARRTLGAWRAQPWALMAVRALRTGTAGRWREGAVPPSAVLVRLHLGTASSSRRMLINQRDKLPKEGSK